MKKLISILLVVLLTGILPSYANAVELILSPNQIAYASLPSGWYMDESLNLNDSNGKVGYIESRTYDTPFSNISVTSLDFLKSKYFNNIMLSETIGSDIHIYEAVTFGDDEMVFVFTVANGARDYMLLACVYENKINYNAVKNLATSISLEYTEIEITEEDEEIIEDIGEIENDEEVIEVEEPQKRNNAIGQILSTDIVAYIDDMPIKSYNVDGKTVIVVEDLANYGFTVKWDGETRKLTATTSKLPITAPDYKPQTSDLKIGTVLGEIYLTDIVTEINGREYETYNINGQTVVVIEDLGDRMKDTDTNIYNPYKYSSGGFKTIWDEVERTIKLYCIRPGDMIDTWVGDLQIKEKTEVMKPINYIYTQYDVLDAIIDMVEIDGRMFIDLRKYCEILNLPCEINKSNTLKLDTSMLGQIKLDFTTPIRSDIKNDMLLPLNLIITNGKSTFRSNNSDIAYYYKDGTIMVDYEILMNIVY